MFIHCAHGDVVLFKNRFMTGTFGPETLLCFLISSDLECLD